MRHNFERGASQEVPRTGDSSRPFKWLLLLSLLWSVTALAEEPNNLSIQPPLPRGWPLDEFSLSDQHGDSFTRANLLGQWTIVLLGDTHCGEHCTAALGALTAMRKRIERTQKVNTTQIVFVSISDDSPAQLSRYLAPYDPHFLGVHGNSDVIINLAKDLGMEQLVSKSPSTNAPTAREMLGTLAVVDPEGTFRTQILPPFDVEKLTARYLKLRLY
jgi:protein SCO1